MRIAVYPHDMALGGSQLNAVELAGAVQARGHEVVVFGRAGRLQHRIDELGLELVPSPPIHRRPSPAAVQALRDLIRQRGVDVLHAYEWPPSLEAMVACVGTGAVGVATVMSMSVAPFIPRRMPLLVGTAQIHDAELRGGRRDVTLLEPPVDADYNSPAVLDRETCRSSLGISTSDLAVVVVTRFAHELKLEGLLTAIATVPTLHPTSRLLVVGDGPARPEIEAAAQRSNAAAGRESVVLTGELLDPRPAYRAADIALGMGGSALRAASFATPVVVQGEGGFWEPLTSDTLDQFLWTGWYGVGERASEGSARLRNSLAPLLDRPALRDERGAFARAVVLDRFSLSRAATVQLEVYERAVGTDARELHAFDALRAASLFARYEVLRRSRRLAGRAATDDFNATPVAAVAAPRSMAAR